MRRTRFTVAELEEHSGVKSASISTIIDRNRSWFVEIDVEPTGRRGGQPKVYCLSKAHIDEIIRLLRQGESPPTSDADTPLGLALALRRLLHDLPHTPNRESKRRILNAARANVVEDAGLPASPKVIAYRETCACLATLAAAELGDERPSASEVRALMRIAAEALRSAGEESLRADLLERVLDSPWIGTEPFRLAIEVLARLTHERSLPHARIVSMVENRLEQPLYASSIVSEFITATTENFLASQLWPGVLTANPLVPEISDRRYVEALERLVTPTVDVILRVQTCSSSFALELQSSSAWRRFKIIDNGDLMIRHLPELKDHILVYYNAWLHKIDEERRQTAGGDPWLNQLENGAIDKLILTPTPRLPDGYRQAQLDGVQ